MPSNLLAVCWVHKFPLIFLTLLDLLPTEARISGKEYKERVVNNLKILIVHYSDGGGRRSRFLILFTVHQSHSKAVKRAISEHCGVWTISMLSYFYCFQCIGIRCKFGQLLVFWMEGYGGVFLVPEGCLL
ncbi:hypothetical protein CsSME_00031401 [Camellia sinensis var. sinensis]